jgi:hypothetical protein
MIADLLHLRQLSGLKQWPDISKWLEDWKIAEPVTYESIDAALELQVVPGIPPGMETAEDISAYEALRKRKPSYSYSRPDPKPERTPAWADLEAIRRVYAESRRLTLETGVRHSVDHIIPLCGRTVTGLHVAENLRIITLVENIRKSNRWTDG